MEKLYTFLLLGFLFSIIMIISCIPKKEATESQTYITKYADNRSLKISNIKIPKEKIEKYSLFEIILDIQGTYNNPFDPEEIDILGHFTDPDGKEITVPGFFYQEYKRELKVDYEDLTPISDPEFRIRFSPIKTGIYKFYISVKDKTKRHETSKIYSFEVIDSKNPGFVRVSKKDFHYFEFDNGEPFIPIGANVCWAGGKGTFDFDIWLPKYAEVGGNYFRVWLGPSWTTFALEKSSVREYDLKNAWRLDYILDLSSKLGLYVMLCFDSYNELRYQREGAYPFWEHTPHNIKNGGPIKEPREFWTNKEMIKYYRNKIRYIVARYGYKTNVFAWEFWNEVDIISPTAYIPERVRNWHDEMCKYIKSLDPWNHLVTTSFSSSPGKSDIDSLSGIDFVQTHIYQSKNYIDSLRSLIEHKEKYKKPHLVGEFGLDVGGNDPLLDPEGYAIHNAIWTTLLSGSCGSAMSWWWDNHIHPNNLYFHYKALGEFIKDVKFTEENFKRVKNYKISGINRNLKIFGLSGKNYTLLWLYDPNMVYSYKKELPKIFPENILGTLSLPMEKGKYKVIFFDAYKGETVKYEIIESFISELKVNIPNFERDMGIKIQLLK